MDSGLEERILPSIRRPQMLLIHRNGGVDNPETFGQIACSVGLRREKMETYGQFACAVGVIRRMETCGQIACTARLSERWRPAVRSRARSGDYPSVSRWAQAARSEGHRRHDQCVSTGGTISVWAQATRSVFCRAESALVADSATIYVQRWGGEPL